MMKDSASLPSTISKISSTACCSPTCQDAYTLLKERVQCDQNTVSFKLRLRQVTVESIMLLVRSRLCAVQEGWLSCSGCHLVGSRATSGQTLTRRWGASCTARTLRATMTLSGRIICTSARITGGYSTISARRTARRPGPGALTWRQDWRRPGLTGWERLLTHVSVECCCMQFLVIHMPCRNGLAAELLRLDVRRGIFCRGTHCLPVLGLSAISSFAMSHTKHCQNLSSCP